MAIGNTSIIVEFLGNTRGLDAAINRTNQRMRGMGTVATRTGALMAAALGVGIGASVRAFANFDDAMTKSLAIMGDISPELRAEMEETARVVARTTTFSATEAAEAYFFLASAGLSAETSLAALPQAARFAQAGNFDLARATDLLTDAQSTMGLKSKDAAENLENMARVSDVLVKANTIANMSTEQFALALTSKAGPALRILGKDIEEGTALLSVFADQGIKGQKAGTQLAIVLRDLTTKSIKNPEAWAKYGIAVFDSAGEMRNMADIVGDMEGALDGLSTKQKRAALLQLGLTDRSVNATMVLLGNSDAIREYEASLRDASGFTDSVAEKQLESFKAQWSLLKSEVIDVGIEIGSRVVPHLLKVVKKLRAWFTDNREGISEFFDRVAIGISRVVEFVRANWPTVILAFEKAKEVFNAVRDVVMRVVESFRGGTEEMNGKSSRIIEMFQRVRDKVEEVLNRIIPIFEEVIAIITAVWEIWGETIVNKIASVVEAVFNVLAGLIEIVQGLMEIISGLLTGDWDKIWSGMKHVVSGAVDAVVGIVKFMWENVKFIWGLITGLIGSAGQTLWDGAKALGGKVVDGIAAGFRAGLDAVKTAAGSVADAIWGKIKGGINKIIDGWNGIEFKMPDFDGLKVKGVTIIPGFDGPKLKVPQIPRLARGGLVASPTLAMVGDTIGDSEIVSPTNMMREIVREEAGGVQIGKIEVLKVNTPADITAELRWMMRTNNVKASV